MRLLALLSAVVVAVSMVTLAPQQIGVYMAGDSTMADRPNPEKNPYRGWGQLLPQFFDDGVVVHNLAVNGRSTKSFIDEGKWAALIAQVRPGDYVFIQFGHNDEKKEDSLRYTEPNGSYRRNLERFVKEARDKGANPVLLTSIVRRSFDEHGTLRDTHGGYPQATRDVARDLGVPLIDLEKTSGALVATAGAEGSRRLFGYVAPGQSEMYPEGLKDDTHLSLSGATAVARLAAQGILSTGLPLARHVKGVR